MAQEALPDRQQVIEVHKVALALLSEHDQQQIAALHSMGRPFAPDRLQVTPGKKVAALQFLKVPQLLERFAAGDVIAATDQVVVASMPPQLPIRVN